MADLAEAAGEFLAQKRIAVAGASRKKSGVGNVVYRKLRDAGIEVFPVNPKADTIEGDPAYPDLKSIPDGVDGVFVATHPEATLSVVRECVELGIGRVWIHKSLGKGSYAEEAVALCREHGINVIPGGCPMMFCEPVDIAHKCLHWVLGVTGGLPKEV